jgi:hypothetical protein
MARYGVTIEGAAGAAANPIGDISATASPRRVSLYDILFGSDGTPDDKAYEWVLQRSSAHGTRSATVTPAPLDLADAACAADVGQGYTIDPTQTAATELLDFALNQRATFRWVAAPDGELIIPATDNAGIVFNVNHASGTDNQKVAHFVE